MTVTTLDMVARITRITRITRIIVRRPRRRIGMAMVTVMATGVTEHMGDLVGTEVTSDGLPQRRALDRPRCVLARPLNPLEGDVSPRGDRSGRPSTRLGHRAGDLRRAGHLPVGVVALARVEAARNSRLWYTIRRG